MDTITPPSLPAGGPTVLLTPAALKKIQSLLDEQGDPNLKLRMSVRGGGCSGFQYGFAFDGAENSDDVVITHGTVTVLVDPMSIQYLHGATLDYVEELMGSQFVIKNPNATTTCGCGSSFGA